MDVENRDLEKQKWTINYFIQVRYVIHILRDSLQMLALHLQLIRWYKALLRTMGEAEQLSYNILLSNFQ